MKHNETDALFTHTELSRLVIKLLNRVQELEERQDDVEFRLKECSNQVAITLKDLTEENHQMKHHPCPWDTEGTSWEDFLQSSSK